MSPTRVLVFGATGYLGRRVVAALTARPGVEVVPVRRGGPPGGDHVRHDLVSTDPADLLSSTAPDAVVNCTGRLGGTATELVAANVTAVARLLDALPAATRLVTLGSAAEYGVVPVGRPVGEDAPEKPVSAYGATKLSATGLVRAAVAAGRADAVVLRVFNPVGAGAPHDTVLGRAVAAIRSAATGVRLGPLGAHRDFVDVRDIAEAVALAALATGAPGPVLNIGSGTAVVVRDAVKLLVEESGFTGQVVESDPAPDRSRAVDWIAADVTRAREVLGWRPRHDLRASVRDLWAGGSG
ncbi:NAD-dependent epimerase/dehydratase family protein [Saccharothrix syringae]|uniref:NAD(P)-dependent oxidoreductase n=1 Tax=Saccharothrix syringae TaxID=103733 RepID=A0A5Q0H200_SACSY|nr:NAD(P)-dependent oxidoreductase [Saccharothrix syringae]QFZ20228.1 NAD(P)-dependent oxidoreductase [Saccharothrix syringae]